MPEDLSCGLVFVSHCAISKYHARKAISAAYEKRFYVSEKQIANLDSGLC